MLTRMRYGVFVLAATLAVGATLETDATKKGLLDSLDAKRLVGRWKVVSSVWYGRKGNNDIGTVFQFTAKGEVLHHAQKGPPIEGEYKVDFRHKPARVDIMMDGDRPEMGGGGLRKGILKFAQGRLVICVQGAAKRPYPKEFASKKGQLTILRVLEKVKKKKK